MRKICNFCGQSVPKTNFYLRHKNGDCTKKNVKSKYRLSSLRTMEVIDNIPAVDCDDEHMGEYDETSQSDENPNNDDSGNMIS